MKNFIFIIVVFIFLIIGCSSNEVTDRDDKINIEKTKQAEVVNMKLTSPAFVHNGKIPSEYTCDGSDTSPELNIADVPKNAKGLVLINDYPDAPVGTWDHWIVFNIPPTT